MSKIIRKLLAAIVLVSLASSLSACRTTRDERIMIGTAVGVGIGAGVAASTDEDFVASISIGAACGAIAGFLSEDL